MLFQQGDIILEKVVRLPDDCKKLGHLVLAEGEVTGHKHEVLPQGNLIKLVEKDGQMFVKSKVDFKVKHDEHGTIEIPDGIYKVRKVREYNHFAEEAREVKD